MAFNLNDMKYRYVLDRLIVVVLVALAFISAQDWMRDQFVVDSLKGSSFRTGGEYIGRALTALITAIFYQFFISQHYDNKFKDGFVLVLVLGLILMAMVRLGLNWVGVAVVLSSLSVLVYLEKR